MAHEPLLIGPGSRLRPFLTLSSSRCDSVVGQIRGHTMCEIATACVALSLRAFAASSQLNRKRRRATPSRLMLFAE